MWRVAGHLPSPEEDCSDSCPHRELLELGGTGQHLVRHRREDFGAKGSLPVDG